MLVMSLPCVVAIRTTFTNAPKLSPLSRILSVFALKRFVNRDSFVKEWANINYLIPTYLQVVMLQQLSRMEVYSFFVVVC